MIYIFTKAKTAKAGMAIHPTDSALSRGAAAPVYRPLAADVVFVELPDEDDDEGDARETMAVDVLADETTAEEEDFKVDGMAVLGLVFPGETPPPGAGEADVGDGLDPGTLVAVLVPGTGTGTTVPVGAAPGFVTVYTTVPVTTVSVVVKALR